MAEEEKNEQQSEETPEETPGQAPEGNAAEEQSQAVEQPEAEAAEEPAEGGDDALEGLDWKARRRLERSRQPAEARPQRPSEERAAARAERRSQARKVRASYRRKRREKHEGGTGTAPAERDSVARKMRQGTVVSDRADKTITVRIDVARRHPVYEKIVRSSNTLHAHDERNEAGEGDLVRIVETRPISRSKRWRLVEILEKAK